MQAIFCELSKAYISTKLLIHLFTIPVVPTISGHISKHVVSRQCVERKTVDGRVMHYGRELGGEGVNGYSWIQMITLVGHVDNKFLPVHG